MQFAVVFRIKSAIVHNFRSFFLLVLRKESIFIPFFTKQVFNNDDYRKQIILAFTPSEYSEEIKGVLNSAVVSSFNYLGTDETVTTIKEV